jgi:hypothetical protein
MARKVVALSVRRLGGTAKLVDATAKRSFTGSNGAEMEFDSLPKLRRIRKKYSREMK